MKEIFESDLSASQKGEVVIQNAYEDPKAAKEDDTAAGQVQVEAKTNEPATTDEVNAQAEADLEDTRAPLPAVSSSGRCSR